MKKFILKNKVVILLILMIGLVGVTILGGIYGPKYLARYFDFETEQKNQKIDTSDYYKPEMPAVSIPVEQEQNQRSDSPTASEKVPEIKEEETDTSIPEKAIINIDFMSQAPEANWDALHEDACEEASFLMVKQYYDETSIGSASEFDRELKSMILYEDQNGYGPSITAEQLVKIAKEKFNMVGQIKTASIESIEKDISLGHPVIVPAAGKLLGNPNFRNGGPNYHMLVIKGYNSSNFITNDPGTRKGNGYVYDKNILMNAIHNYDSNDMKNGPAVYIVF